MRTDKIKLNPDNPRTIDKDKFEKLKKSIQEFPEMLVLRPIVINEDNIVLGGNMRYRAAQALGIADIPVTIAKNLTKEQQREFVIKDNTSGGEWDWSALANEWDAEQLDEWGLDLPKDFIEDAEVVEDDYEVDVPEEAKSKLGDIYILGEHRLMCGDATKKEDVEKLMDGAKADMVYTDPPYGMALDVDYDKMFAGDKTHKDKGDRFDAVIADDTYFDPTQILELFSDVKEVLLWGADYFYDSLPRGGSMCAWDKRTETLDAVIGNTTEFLWSKTPHRRMTARVLWSGHHGMGKDDEKKRIHPTQKPIELHKWVFDNFAKSFELIVDVFGGSGSTLIACEQTKRKCYMMELDPKYVDVIIDRWEKFTGNKAELCRS